MENQRIALAVDAVVFGYREENLHLLLVKQKYGPFQGRWVLPGGFVRENETLAAAVARELVEETNVKTDYLEQLYTFGDDLHRDPRGRVVAVAYLGLVNPQKLTIRADTDATDVAWYHTDELPDLPYDHHQIVKKGLERLQAKVHYQPIGFDLLEEEFVFSELESLYKTILQQAIDRRNFRKKILSFGILAETGKVRKVGSGRPGMVYKFNKQKYRELEKAGFHFEIKFA